MPTCRACGAQAPDDARFCPTCGTTFLAGAPPPGGAPRPTPYMDPMGQPWEQRPAPPAPDPYGSPYGTPAPGPGFPAGGRPFGVAIVSIWSLVAGPVFSIIGIGMATLGPQTVRTSEFRAQLEQQLGQQVPAETLASVVVVLGLFLVVLGVLSAIAGYGLFSRRPWAWGAAMGVSGGWLVLGLFLFPAGLLLVAIAIGALWYFTRPGVKAYLGRGAPDMGMPGYVPPPSPPPM